MGFNSIDLFAGGGALSEGMRQAGFEILSAVEIDNDAAETFRVNHAESSVIERDIRYVSSTELLRQSKLRKGELDLLAGCPPCQGFSSLTAKYKRDDERNSLISEVSRLVTELLPRAIMIENVPGLMTTGKKYLDSFIETLESLGYIVDKDILQVADYGVPQSRRRFVLLAGLGFKIQIPKPTHSNKECSSLPKWNTVRSALRGLGSPTALNQADCPNKLNWHVTRVLEPINIERLKHVRPGGQRFDIPERLRPNCHKGKDSGFGNVYGRMEWDNVAPTITGGCTTLSKGRFGHPSELRTISVREAARLQTFPDTFEFPTLSMEHACRIIGNALPCEFAKKMSLACYEQLRNDGLNRTVLKRSDGKWVNKKNNSLRITSQHHSQIDAIEKAKQQIINNGGGRLTIIDEDNNVSIHSY